MLPLECSPCWYNIGMHNYTCTVCGKAFTDDSPIRKTCSRECRNKSRMSSPNDFWSHVDKSKGPDGCWPWMKGHSNYKGYGSGTYQGKGFVAHRLAWELHNHSTIPTGMCVLHACDNPGCCNPLHLRIGTNAENVADRMARGRSNLPRNEKAYWAKLTWANVREIRGSFVPRVVTHADLAKRFGVHKGTIASVLSGRKWIE